MSKSMKLIMMLLIVASLCLMGLLGNRLWQNWQLLQEQNLALTESRNHWESIAAEKESLQAELKELNNQLKEAKLTLTEAEERNTELQTEIETLLSDIALLEAQLQR